MAAVISAREFSAVATGHRWWVRITHWVMAASVITLAFSGFVILMAHPRLYWGNAGNDLTPALIELPISRNYRHTGWVRGEAFPAVPNHVVSVIRTYDIFNQNSWARSLHFLAAWGLVSSLTLYLALGILSGHLRRDLLPRLSELRPARLKLDLRAHFRLPLAAARGGPPYGLLQKSSYAFVAVGALPLMVITGLTMAPAVTAAYPSLLDVFGGSQSARTIHFFGFVIATLFLLVHLGMVALTGFRRQMRAMIRGN